MAMGNGQRHGSLKKTIWRWDQAYANKKISVGQIPKWIIRVNGLYMKAVMKELMTLQLQPQTNSDENPGMR